MFGRIEDRGKGRGSAARIGWTGGEGEADRIRLGGWMCFAQERGGETGFLSVDENFNLTKYWLAAQNWYRKHTVQYLNPCEIVYIFRFFRCAKFIFLVNLTYRGYDLDNEYRGMKGAMWICTQGW